MENLLLSLSSKNLFRQSEANAIINVIIMLDLQGVLHTERDGKVFLS